jgi:hypothetical protein
MLTLVIGLIVLVTGFLKLLTGSYENLAWPLTFIAIGSGGVFISLMALVIKYLFT